MFRLLLAICVIVVCGSSNSGHSSVSADEPAKAKAELVAVKIIAEPKESRPFAWKRGDKVTVGVRLTSEERTRVIGVATDVTLVATKTYPNRVVMMLKAPRKTCERILAMAKISEFWFEVMPFKQQHVATLKSDVSPTKFLKTHEAYRAVDATDWGIGASLAPPEGDELPKRSD